MGKFINLIGQKFHWLTVVEFVSEPKECRRQWKCYCDCGNQTFVPSNALRKGRTKSCGCQKQTLLKKSLVWKGCGEMSGSYWGDVLSGAKRRNLFVSISKKDAWELFEKQNKKCSLSGRPLHFESYDRASDGTASLDRIDSSLGYIEGNVQWIHKDLQPMKMAMTEDKFLKLIYIISDYKRGKAPPINDDQWSFSI